MSHIIVPQECCICGKSEAGFVRVFFGHMVVCYRCILHKDVDAIRGEMSDLETEGLMRMKKLADTWRDAVGVSGGVEVTGEGVGDDVAEVDTLVISDKTLLQRLSDEKQKRVGAADYDGASLMRDAADALRCVDDVTESPASGMQRTTPIGMGGVRNLHECVDCGTTVVGVGRSCPVCDLRNKTMDPNHIRHCESCGVVMCNESDSDDDFVCPVCVLRSEVLG